MSSRHHRLALACRYISDPDMESAVAVHDEIDRLIKELPRFPGIAIAAAGSNRIDILDKIELQHGKNIWTDFEYYDEVCLNTIEDLNLSDDLKFSLYCRAMRQNPTAIRVGYLRMLTLGAEINSRSFIRALLTVSPPKKSQVVEILKSRIVMENEAFRTESRHIFESLREFDFTDLEKLSLSMDIVAYVIPRSFALLAKTGLAVEISRNLVMVCPNDCIKLMNEKLKSNHGIIDLAKRLPDVKSLLRPREKTLTKNISFSLT